MKHIALFSGGKDSTAMLFLILENNLPLDEIIFNDTTVEFPDMYSHINEVKKYLYKNYNKQITTIKAPYDYEYYLTSIKRTKGKLKFLKGYGFARGNSRWCTTLLKQKITRQYLLQKYPNQQICQYIGIAYDEQQRIDQQLINKNLVQYPLIDFKITETMALQICKDRGFNWNGLYDKFKRVSCFCCPLKSLDELQIIYNDYPDLWQRIKKQEENTFNSFRTDYTVRGLEMYFNGINNLNK